VRIPGSPVRSLLVSGVGWCSQGACRFAGGGPWSRRRLRAGWGGL